MSLTEDLGMVDELDCLPEFEEDAESVNRALQRHMDLSAVPPLPESLRGYPGAAGGNRTRCETGGGEERE